MTSSEHLRQAVWHLKQVEQYCTDRAANLRAFSDNTEARNKLVRNYTDLSLTLLNHITHLNDLDDKFNAPRLQQTLPPSHATD